MKHRQLGHTGLRVSAFGMGCGNFGGIGSAPEFFGQGESETEAFALLDEAVDLGINFLDTADAYGGGRSEATIGKWLATKDAATRDRLLISSKVANPVGDDPNQRGLSRRHILRQIDASLSRLGVDHLDMYLAHEPDPTTPLEETLDGKARKEILVKRFRGEARSMGGEEPGGGAYRARRTARGAGAPPVPVRGGTLKFCCAWLP